MSVYEKMTAIANPIRTLSDKTVKLGLDDMASDLTAVVGAVDTQHDLIRQIKNSLEGKALPGGGLPALDNPGTADDLALGKQLIDADGNVVDGNVAVRDSGTWGWTDGTVFTTPAEGWADKVVVQHFIESGTVMYRGPVTMAIGAPLSDFGDAQPSDVRAGKKFTSAAGLQQVGTGSGGGMVVRSGTTANGNSINTGLSDVEHFFIYKESLTATGLIHLHYSKLGTSRMYASAWSTQNYGTKTITNGTGGVTVNGGTVTISATQAAQGALTSGVAYKWIAIGVE